MKRRLLNFLPYAPAILATAGLFVLVGLSKDAWRGAQRPVPADPYSLPDLVLAPPVGFKDWQAFEDSLGAPRLRLPIQTKMPAEPWTCSLMRAERSLWTALEETSADSGSRTLDELLKEIEQKSGWELHLEHGVRRDIAVTAAQPDATLADTLRATTTLERLSVVPSDWGTYAKVTPSPRLSEWRKTWPLVRVLWALSGRKPDASESAWLKLERPAPTPPDGSFDVNSIARWLEKTTGLSVEITDEARRWAEVSPPLHFAAPDDGDTVESCARVALLGAGLDVAARRGTVVVCLRREADSLAAARLLTREWSQDEWTLGLSRLSDLDSRVVVLEGWQYPLGNLIVEIAKVCSPYPAVDDVTWDDPTLIAIPAGEYTVRELRAQLWVSAGVRMYALKDSIWFVEPAAE